MKKYSFEVIVPPTSIWRNAMAVNVIAHNHAGFFPDVNPTAWMTCSLCKWKAVSFPFLPHNEKNHCKGSATNWAPWSLVFPKVSQKSIVWKHDLMRQALQWTKSIILFCIKWSTVRASVGCDDFDLPLCIITRWDMLAPMSQNIVVDGLPPQAEKSAVMGFFWKMLLSFDSQTTCNYTGQYHPVKWNIVLIACLLMTEGYKNTNQLFQEKYKKKATRKDVPEVKTSISLKKIRKMHLFFRKVNTADSTAKSSYDFPHCCGQKHISHYFWKR